MYAVVPLVLEGSRAGPRHSDVGRRGLWSAVRREFAGCDPQEAEFSFSMDEEATIQRGGCLLLSVIKFGLLQLGSRDQLRSRSRVV